MSSPVPHPARLPILVIGNKVYSSWSLRAWVYMTHNGLAFEERRVPLYQPESKPELLAYSPSGKVPVLIEGSLVVWDSLAIMEYLAERHPQTRGWPRDRDDRAHARAISSEMHSGFASLRQSLPMNLRRKAGPHTWGADVDADIDRVVAIWEGCRARHGAAGPFLFGPFGIADAMYAPVAFRFQLYGVDLSAAARGYCDTVLALPAMRAWQEEALRETEVLPQLEAR
jgi:glutathione S-transferase